MYDGRTELNLTNLTKLSAKDIDPKDPQCTGYRDVKQCIIDATSEICGVAPIF